MEHSPLYGGDAEDKIISASEGRTLAGLEETVARWAVYLSALLVPVLYLPGTVEALDLPKQLILIVLSIVATLAWLGTMLVRRRAEVRRTPVYLLALVFLGAYGASAWFSKNPYLSLAGDSGQEKASFATVACFVLLLFTGINVVRNAKEVKNALMFGLLGGFIVMLHAVTQLAGLRLLPGAPAQANVFNLIGTSNALGVYAAAMLVLVMGSLLMSDREPGALLRRILLGALGAVSLVYVAALSFWALWAMIIAGALILVAYGMARTEKVSRVTMLAVPMAAIVIGALFMLVRFPLTFGLPAEVMPSLKASWNISREALARGPLLGSGPGTFLYEYTQFRSRDLNGTNFWDIQFDRSSSRLLTMLATTGVIAFVAYLLLILFLGLRTALALARGRDDWQLTLAIFAAWVTLLVGKVLYSSNMALETLFWSLTAWLVALEWRRRREVEFEASPRAALILSFCFIVAVILSVAGAYMAGQRYVAERHYARGVTRPLATETDVSEAAASLLRATQLNPNNDLYFRTLGQALALQTNLELQKSGGKPDEATAQRIAVLAANAVNAGKRAADMNPSDVRNWSSLAAMYRDLGPATPGASEAAENAYAAAVAIDPNNPILHTELGKVFLAMADAALQQAGTGGAENAALKAAADERHQKALENFNKAIELKQDYAPAHYWVAVLLQRQGKTNEAVAKLESVRNYNPNDLGVGFQLGILYYQTGAKAKAIAEMERLIRLSPQYSNARWYLAAMYEEEGRIDDAIAQVQEVLNANPDNPDIQQRLESLSGRKAGGGAGRGGLPEPVDTPTGSEVIP